MTLGVGVIGVGVLGRRHAENVARLAPRARLVAVADAHAAAAESVAREFGCVWTAEPRELMARLDVHAVVIATGSDTHASLTSAAAAAGKDILCEKPLALSVGAAQDAADAADRAGVRLQISFMRRYDPAYRAAYEAIERGEIGRPVLFAAISRDAQPPPRGYFASPGAGGLFIDSAIHDFDLARWMMRDEVAAVSATGSIVACHDLADVQSIDLGLATLTFKGGAAGSVQVYRCAVYGYDIRTEVVGTEGTVQVGNHWWRAVQVLRAGGITHTMPQHWLERFGEAYGLEMADWVDRMARDQPAAVTGEDGVRAVVLAVAAEQARESSALVHVP